MNKRPKSGETEEDILRMQKEFLLQKAKNPKLQPSAQIVKVEKAPKKSLFARSRVKADSAQEPQIGTAPKPIPTEPTLGEIYGNGSQNSQQSIFGNIMIGDIVEKRFEAPKAIIASYTEEAFPRVDKTQINVLPRAGKSIFALSTEAKQKASVTEAQNNATADESMECEAFGNRNLNEVFGSSSVIVEDNATATSVHKENLEFLSKMREEEILAERKRLLDSIDPTLVALLAKRRQQKVGAKMFKNNEIPGTVHNVNPAQPMEVEAGTTDPSSALPASNAAVEILERSSAEHWIHFDVVEKDKLEWMRDIPKLTEKLKPDEKFEARFDWKGVLLPYSTEEITKASGTEERDERELYLHGDDPHRPGYTLQELFRLARSNVMQQRLSAFGAIAGILNIYNQGFYDHVLELPISKIFFLLRFGLDDNTPAMLEVVSKALAYLFYNETDETLLDFIYENPGCHWQPTLHVLRTDTDSDDPTSIENLQKQMQQLQMNVSNALPSYKANVEENEDESKTSMSDFELAETDLIECLLRTNIIQRIYFVMHKVRPDNSTVSSCLKLLIRIARSGNEAAAQIADNDNLLQCLFGNFLPGLERVDTTTQTPCFYNYPQYLCLKLIRILISQNLSIALKFVNLNIIDKLQNYLFNREDIKDTLIKVQIESLRVVRCLLLLRVDITLYKKLLHAFHYMLEWHLHHVIYEEGGPFLIRQHAAALLAAITSCTSGVGHEVNSLLGATLHDCCSNWFYRATRNGVKEFSQATLLSACINAVLWFARFCDSSGVQSERFRNFNEKYLRGFITSQGFVNCVNSLVSSSIVLRNFNDRRNVHQPLPNAGAVLMHQYGPQLIIPQTYAIFLLNALWSMVQELQLESDQKLLLDALIRPEIVEPLVQYLRALTNQTNRYLGTNFYAKIEVKLIFKLLCFEGFSVYFDKAQMLQLVYNFLCCLTAEHIPEIETMFERVIFNKHYIDIDEESLQKWRDTCLELVYPHYIIVRPTELTFSLPFSQPPVLPNDWPYFQLKVILQNYIENVQQKPTAIFSEREVLRMTLTFVAQLERSNPQLQIATPTEKLMYLMIAFMGPDSQFLEADMQQLLREHLLRFYEQCKNQTFQFDAVYEGKCKFENLYALFVDHFQAASYGDELFSSLVLVPLAQRYDNKWRRRVWSDYASALRFLNCDESVLLGGMDAYLEPPEEEESLIKAYATALNTNLVRPHTIPYKIAKYHVDKFKERLNK